MAELDQKTAMDLVKLLGEVTGFKDRFDSLDSAVAEVRKGVHERIDRHEEREEPRLLKIERMLWIGVGGVLLIAALVPVGLFIVQYTLAKV